METIEKRLPIRLTQDELEVKSSELAKALKKKGEIEAEKKSFNGRLISQLEEVEIEIGNLTNIVYEKTEYRPVRCEIRFNYERSIVEILRTDVGQVVESRSMTIDEKQQKLQFDSDN